VNPAGLAPGFLQGRVEHYVAPQTVAVTLLFGRLGYKAYVLRGGDPIRFRLPGLNEAMVNASKLCDVAWVPAKLFDIWQGVKT
jgi:hypothetical protein